MTNTTIVRKAIAKALRIFWKEFKIYILIVLAAMIIEGLFLFGAKLQTNSLIDHANQVLTTN